MLEIERELEVKRKMKEVKKVKNKESKKEKNINGVWKRYTQYLYSEKISK